MTSPDPDLRAAAQAARAAVLDELRSRRCVNSIEVARRWREHAPTGEVGIRVTVERLLPPDEVPEGELFPSQLMGVPVDVVEGAAPGLQGLG